MTSSSEKRLLAIQMNKLRSFEDPTYYNQALALFPAGVYLGGACPGYNNTPCLFNKQGDGPAKPHNNQERCMWCDPPRMARMCTGTQQNVLLERLRSWNMLSSGGGRGAGTYAMAKKRIPRAVRKRWRTQWQQKCAKMRSERSRRVKALPRMAEHNRLARVREINSELRSPPPPISPISPSETEDELPGAAAKCRAAPKRSLDLPERLHQKGVADHKLAKHVTPLSKQEREQRFRDDFAERMAVVRQHGADGERTTPSTSHGNKRKPRGAIKVSRRRYSDDGSDEDKPHWMRPGSVAPSRSLADDDDLCRASPARFADDDDLDDPDIPPWMRPGYVAPPLGFDDDDIGEPSMPGSSTSSGSGRLPQPPVPTDVPPPLPEEKPLEGFGLLLRGEVDGDLSS
jgi:hypothetical protein